jgi:hypothetical protein
MGYFAVTLSPASETPNKAAPNKACAHLLRSMHMQMVSKDRPTSLSYYHMTGRNTNSLPSLCRILLSPSYSAVTLSPPNPQLIFCMCFQHHCSKHTQLFPFCACADGEQGQAYQPQLLVHDGPRHERLAKPLP